MKSSIDFFGFLHGCLAALVACKLDPFAASYRVCFRSQSLAPRSRVRVLLRSLLNGISSTSAAFGFLTRIVN